MLDLIPIGTRIIVKQIKIEKIGRIVVPENSREAKELMATEGTVLAVGSDVDTDVISVNQQVYWGQYAGVLVQRNKEEFRILDQCDVIALVKKSTENLLNIVPIKKGE